ncbi:hypothetical protein BXU08_03925 [Sphingomonas sp. LM7]|nr:hypothetical protein BXU08_03925 [Sphingomonas sp. LM7]
MSSSVALATSLMLAACGGGDSSGGGVVTPTPTPAPTATNNAPVFNSATTGTVAENTTATFYTATGTDADGNTITYSIGGGTDSPLFRIDASGHLAFRAAPDFEAPGDANRDNVYQVTLVASDGVATTSLALQVTVTNATAGAYHARQLAATFTQPNNLVVKPGDATRVFVTEKTGAVRLLTLATGAAVPTPFLDLSAEVTTSLEAGLLGFAADPDYVANGYVYVALVTPANNLEVRRYRALPGTREIGNPASADVILSVPTPDNNFTGGWLGFGTDGNLYVTTGNGPEPGTDKTNLAGKVLRIDVRSDAYPADPLRDYAIPAGNPFATTGGRPEIWATGFRHPRRAAFDTFTNNLYVDDLGAPVSAFYEPEINMIRPQDAGSDFSPWRERLGSSGPLGAGLFYPIFRLGYGLTSPSPANELTLVAGPVYRGPIEPLQGMLVYGSRALKLLAARNAALFDQNVVDPNVYPQISLRTELSPAEWAFAFGEDANRNLYILQPDGKIFVVEPG